MNAYPYRAFYAVAASERAEANVLADSVDPGDGSDTYGTPLVPADGPAGAEATHYVCCTLLTRDQYIALAQQAHTLETLRFTRKDARTGEVLSTSNAGIEESAPCSFDAWLDAESLQLQQLPEDE